MIKKILILVFFITSSSALYADIKQFLQLEDGTDVSVFHYPANGKKLFIWLAPEAGLQEAEKKIAKQLAGKGIEVWYPDLFESNFLPVATSSVEQFPISQLTAIIEAANQGKEIYLLASGRSVIPMMKALRQWQVNKPESTVVKGLIIFSGKFFVETPDPGQAAKILPIVSATNIPVFLLQPAKSPWRWKLDKTLPALAQGGSDVFLQILPDVRDRFYYRPDAVEQEHSLANEIPQMLIRASRVLATLPSRRVAAPLVEEAAKSITASKKERRLTPYPNKPPAPVLTLKNLQGQQISLTDFKGDVVMVNFWASWCPPCVYEMPSMQRLQEVMKGKSFRIVAVNMAEDKATIEKFLKEKVKVDFTILLDSDGTALKRWEVFAFPTTYFIDKQGRLRYGLFGGREWDKPDVERLVERLLQE